MLKLFRAALAAAALPLCFCLPGLGPGTARAQTYHDTGGTIAPGSVPLVGCSPTGPCAGPVSASNPLPVSGTFSASLSGFAPTPSYSQLSVGATSARVALPTGAVVVVYNTGANAAYVTLGNSSVAATTSNDVIQPNSWMAFTVGSNAYLAAIETAGTTSLNISGGSGLPTGAGGGGAGGGSNASVGSTGSAVPGSGTYAAMNVGGNLTGLAGTVNGLKVDGSAVTQPVSAASLPLPSGAATAANQASVIGTVGAGAAATNSLLGGCVYNSSLPTLTTGQGAAVQCDSSARPLVDVANASIAVTGTFWQTTQPVSLSSLPALAAGSNTIGAVDVLGHAGATLDTAAGTSAAQAVGIQGVTGGVAVPVSGTFWQSTQPVSLASLPALATGSNTIGAVTQASGPWSENLTQVGGASVATAASGAQLVGVEGKSGASLDATMAAGTAPTNGLGVVGVYNSSLPALTNGQSGAMQLDSSSRLIVNCASGCGGSGGTSLADEGTFTQGTTSFTPIGGYYNSSITNLTSGQGGSVRLTADRNLFANVNEWAGSALGAMANYGTSPGAVLVPGVNAYITNTPAVSQSGSWTVTANAGTGTFAVSAASLPLPSGAATSANQPSNASQGSTTSGQTGNLSMGAVTTSAPSYTTGQTKALSLDTAGNLRVNGSGVTQPVSGTVTAAQTTAANLNATVVGTGTFAVQAAESGTWNVGLSSGSNTIGAVTQASGPWSMNVTQIAGSASGVTAWGTAPTGASVLNANVNCLSGCGGSGGTSLADEGAFAQGTTSFTPIGGYYNTSITNLTSGQAGSVRLTADRNLFANVNEWAGTVLGAPSNYGTSPGAVAVPGVNAFVTGMAALPTGSNTIGAVTQASGPWAISAASGALVSGALADGAITTIGTEADAAWTSGNGTLVALLKSIAANLVPNDPCQNPANTKHFVAINLTASGQIITATASKKTYICKISAVVPPTTSGSAIALVEGTGTTCATNTYGLEGGTTAATGWTLSNGIVEGGAGYVAIGPPDADSNATAANICIIAAAGGFQISGQAQYVQQ